MNKEEVLNMSRKENQNKDLVELDVMAQAGNIAGRVGACVCCLIVIIYHRITNTMLCSPWIIYFSILGTHYLVKYVRLKKKTDLSLSILYFAMCLLAFVFFILHLVEIKG